MKMQSLVAVFEALNNAKVRFVVAGGVAVNLHGYVRATQDLDLVVGLSPDNALAAVRALAALGYRPQVPVAIEDFAEPDLRRDWIANRQMQVFSVISDEHPETTVDLFVNEPFPFDDEYAAADLYEIVPGVEVRAARLEALIAMKRTVGRKRDEDDIRHLEWILEERREGHHND